MQLEIQRMKQYKKEQGLKAYSEDTEKNPFSGKVICRSYGKAYGRKEWTNKGRIRKVWQCSESYRKKGVMVCSDRHVDEETLEKIFITACNSVLEDSDYFKYKWFKQSENEDIWVRNKAEQFLEVGGGRKEPLEEFDKNFMLKVLDCIKVFGDGRIIVRFYDGSDVECK